MCLEAPISQKCFNQLSIYLKKTVEQSFFNFGAFSLFGRPGMAGWCSGWTSQPTQPIPAASHSQHLIIMLISNFQIQIEY